MDCAHNGNEIVIEEFVFLCEDGDCKVSQKVYLLNSYRSIMCASCRCATVVLMHE